MAAGDGPAWLAGGTYLVTRRIRMLIETWDRHPLREQEPIIGRDKGAGAPLGQQAEFDPVGLRGKRRRRRAGSSRRRRTSAWPTRSTQRRRRSLRRGYNFVDGSDGLGRLDAGLFFIAYQRDPRNQFVPVQTQPGQRATR